MALTVRLRIFAVENIEPIVAAMLNDFSERLDQVRARRHTVDFEFAKVRLWWRGQQTNDLIALARQDLAADSEIQRLKSEEEIDPIVFDQYVGEALSEIIRNRYDGIEWRLLSLCNNRLNVH